MNDELKLQIKKMIIDSLNLEDVCVGDIGDDMALFGDDGLGLDSVDALELGLALQKQFGLQVDSNSENLREHFHSVAALAQFIQSKQS